MWLWTRLSVQTCFLEPTTDSNIKLVQLVQGFYTHLCMCDCWVLKYVDQKELIGFFTNMWSRDNDYRHSTTTVAWLLIEDATLTGQLMKEVEMDTAPFIQLCLYHIEFSFDQWCSKPDKLTIRDFQAQVAMLNILESQDKRLLSYIAASQTTGRLSSILGTAVHFLLNKKTMANIRYRQILSEGLHAIRNLLILIVRLIEVGPLYLIEALNNRLLYDMFMLEQLTKTLTLHGGVPEAYREIASLVCRVLTTTQRRMYHFPTFRRLKRFISLFESQADIKETDLPGASKLRAAWLSFNKCYDFALEVWNECHGLISHSGKNRCQNPQVSLSLEYFPTPSLI
jgi:hypothetical protein